MASVPSYAVDDLEGISLASPADAGTSPLRYVIEDLGAETDERFEYRAPHESFEVHTDPAESAEEEQAVDEALAFLDDLESRRNDPMRLYMREAQRRALIGAEEESTLAKSMEDAARQAIDALAGWPLGLARVLEAVELVRAGTKPVASIIAIQLEEVDAGPLPKDDLSDTILAEAVPGPAPDSSSVDGEVGDPDEAVGASVFEKAAVLRALVDRPEAGHGARRRISAALHALSLSRPFLLRLADSALVDDSEGARHFLAATRRLAAARDRMAGANLRLVLSLAKRYLFSGIPMDDLIQEGNIGLIKAVDKFDWRRGFKFSTMATWWIRQQLSRSVADAALAIRLPVHFRDDVLLIEREARDLDRLFGRSPSIEQLAARLGMKAGKVTMLLRAVSTPLSIDELESELESIGAVAPDPFDALDANQLGQALATLVDALGPRPAMVDVHDQLNGTQRARIVGLCAIRDQARALLDAQLNDEGDARLAYLRSMLNGTYDRYVARHGCLSTRANALAFRRDPDYPLLLSLEHYDEESDRATKAALFTRRTVARVVEPAVAGEPAEALAASMQWRGRVEPAYMARLLSAPAQAVLDALAEAGQVFLNPQDQQWKTADEWPRGRTDRRSFRRLRAGRAGCTGRGSTQPVPGRRLHVPGDAVPDGAGSRGGAGRSVGIDSEAIRRGRSPVGGPAQAAGRHPAGATASVRA